MKYIRTKLRLAMLIPMLAILLIFGVVLTTVLRSSIGNDANASMQTGAVQTANAMSAALKNVEGKVEDVMTAIRVLSDDAKIKACDKAYFSEFEKTVNELAIESTKDIEGLVTSYVRFVPALSYGTSGMFYTDTDGDGVFESVTPTDLDQYEPTDTEHVGWFYTPLENGAATWLEPYYNANIDSMIISYCIPFYLDDGTSFGVAGVDFDFTYLSELVQENNPYSTGIAFMTNSAGNLLYHPDYTNGEQLSGVEGGKYAALAASMNAASDGYINNTDIFGSGDVAGFATISNGWRVCIMPEYSEIYSLLQSEIQLIIIFIAGASIVMLISSILVGRSISRPIANLESTAKDLAEGKLDAVIDTHGKDEIARLGSAMCLLVEQLKNYRGYIDEITSVLDEFSHGKLEIELVRDYQGEFARVKTALVALSDRYKELLGRIQTSANQIAGGSELLSCGAQSLAAGATEQAESVVMLSESLAEVKARIDASAENSITANGFAIKSDATVHEAMSELENMLASMKEISDASNQIRNVIKVIDDIAFQTNILALNAAVEAARAGEAGKGFAVVADEVRNLASKSSQAAKQTTSLIENSIAAVEKGGNIAKSTSDAFNSVTESTHGVVDLIAKIESDSRAQANAIAEISESIERISNVIQSSSATTEESAAACQELTGQSSLLRELVAKFDLSR